MYGTNFNDARALCEAANAHDLAARFVGPDKVGIAFEVRAHAWQEGTPTRWGLWPRWRYPSGADVGNGGPFIALQSIREALPPDDPFGPEDEPEPCPVHRQPVTRCPSSCEYSKG